MDHQKEESMSDNHTNILTLGVDLGATNVEMAAADSDGHIVAFYKHPTNPEQGAGGVISGVVTGVEECLSDMNREACALGIGIAGQVDHEGVVRFAPNLAWHNVYLKKILEERLHMPVVVVNDVRAATWGEWQHGSGKRVNDLVVLFIGTGIGGGVITGGRLLEGCTNTGGELGHMTIVTGGQKCHCSNAGCMEAYASGWAIARRAQAAVRTDPKAGQQLIAIAGKPENITAITVKDAFRTGDPLAKRLVAETGHYLAAGAVGIVNAFNPCLLVLGGGVIEGLPGIVGMVEKGVRMHALGSAVENLSVVKAALGNKAGVIGAADLARNFVTERDTSRIIWNDK
jgi:glucokinase